MENKNDAENKCCETTKGLLFIIKYNQQTNRKFLVYIYFDLKKLYEMKNKWNVVVDINKSKNKVNSTKSQFQKPPHNNSWPAQ